MDKTDYKLTSTRVILEFFSTIDQLNVILNKTKTPVNNDVIIVNKSYQKPNQKQ